MPPQNKKNLGKGSQFEIVRGLKYEDILAQKE